MSIAENLRRVEAEIADACRRVNRSPDEVTLMAVSKVHPVECMVEAYAAGQRLFGENRVQEFQIKAPVLRAQVEAAAGQREAGGQVECHLIGPLQSNKTNKAAELFDAVDTIDDLRIAQRLETAAAALRKRLPVLVEVKLSHEESKHGVPPEALALLLDQMKGFSQIVVKGLMTVPPWSEDPETARPYFRELRRLRDEMVKEHPTVVELSMGMSNDFGVAIEEGSTCVRIGTAIFGRRVSPR